jgi:two-component system sensor histidine kinase PhoQ
VDIPENLNMQSPTVTLIYDAKGKLLWAQRDVAWLAKRIQPEWLKSNGFHEIEPTLTAAACCCATIISSRRSWTPFASRMMVRK